LIRVGSGVGLLKISKSWGWVSQYGTDVRYSGLGTGEGGSGSKITKTVQELKWDRTEWCLNSSYESIYSKVGIKTGIFAGQAYLNFSKSDRFLR
jgi:hypothetical protein